MANQHATVPYCVPCGLGPLCRDRMLVCPNCTAVLEDFRPEKKRVAAAKQMKWEESGNRIRLYFRDKIVALVYRDVYRSLDDSGGLTEKFGSAYYCVLDCPAAQVLGLTAGPPVPFDLLASARAALERLIASCLRI